MSIYSKYPSNESISKYSSFSAFPASSSDGALALALDTDILYAYSTGSASWVAIASPAAGAAISDLTGDVSASGPGSAVATLATVNASPGTFGDASHSLAAIVNGKGLITSLSSQSIQIAESQVTNLVSDLAAKVDTSSLGDLTDAGTDGIVVTGGTGAVVGSVSLAQHVADSTHNGYLSSADWSTFNGKQDSGNYITALTGDGSASGPGSAALTLATVNASPGSFGDASHSLSATVNGKGLITALSSNSIQIAESQVTNLTTDLAAKVGGASSLTTAGAVPYVASSGVLTQDASFFFYDSTNHAARIGTNAVIGSGQTESLTVLTATTSAITAGQQNGASIASTSTGDFANTASLVGIRLGVTRGITTSQTDTAAVLPISLVTTFNVPAAQTLTNTSGTGYAGINLAAPTISGGGSLAFTRFMGMNLAANSINTGTYKVGMFLGAQTGATNNSVLADTFSAGNFFINSINTNPSLLTGELQLNGAGKGISIKDGSNCRLGTATLVGGTVTVNNTAVTANSRIFLTSQSDGGTPGFLRITAKTASTSFVITSSSGTDTSTVAWMIVEPL